MSPKKIASSPTRIAGRKLEQNQSQVHLRKNLNLSLDRVKNEEANQTSQITIYDKKKQNKVVEHMISFLIGNKNPEKML